MKSYTIVILLMAFGISRSWLCSMTNDTSAIIFNSIEQDNEQEIIALLKSYTQVDLHSYDDWGATLLHRAIEKKYREVAQLLITLGANVNQATTLMQRSPLYYAVQTNYTPMVQLLLDNNANINQADTHGQTPLHRAALDNLDDMIKLLLNHNADTTIADNDRHTFLYYAFLDDGNFSNIPKTDFVICVLCLLGESYSQQKLFSQL